MSRETQWNDRLDELLTFLNRAVTDNHDFLKRRYLWLTPSVLRHSRDMTHLLERELAVSNHSPLTEEEKSHLVFEVFIASYSVAMSAADRIVQNKTSLTAKARSRISEDSLGITLQFCEETFEDVGLDFGRIFDIYAGYQYLHDMQSKMRQDSVCTSGVRGDLQNRMKAFFGISFVSESVAQHFTDRVIKQIPRLPADVVSAFAGRNLVVPALFIAIDAFYLEQSDIDEMVIRFLQAT
jgi:hypothetical protein